MLSSINVYSLDKEIILSTKFSWLTCFLFINVKGMAEEENSGFSWLKGFLITKLCVIFAYSILSTLWYLPN